MQSMVNETWKKLLHMNTEQVQVRVVNLALYQAAKLFFQLTNIWIHFSVAPGLFWGTNLQPSHWVNDSPKQRLARPLQPQPCGADGWPGWWV